MQQVEPLSCELSLHKRHTGDIANWAAQAGKKAGSMAILKTIGIFVVTALAATAEAVPGVTITVTGAGPDRLPVTTIDRIGLPLRGIRSLHSGPRFG